MNDKSSPKFNIDKLGLKNLGIVGLVLKRNIVRVNSVNVKIGYLNSLIGYGPNQLCTTQPINNIEKYRQLIET